MKIEELIDKYNLELSKYLYQGHPSNLLKQRSDYIADVYKRVIKDLQELSHQQNLCRDPKEFIEKQIRLKEAKQQHDTTGNIE